MANTVAEHGPVNDGTVQDAYVHTRSDFKKMFHEEILRVTEQRSKGFNPENKLPPQLEWIFNTCERAYEMQLADSKKIELLEKQLGELSEIVAKLARKDK